MTPSSRLILGSHQTPAEVARKSSPVPSGWNAPRDVLSRSGRHTELRDRTGDEWEQRTHSPSSRDGTGHAFLWAGPLQGQALPSHPEPGSGVQDTPLPPPPSSTVSTATPCPSRGSRFWMLRSRAHAGLRSEVTRGESLFGLADTSDPPKRPFICSEPQKTSQCVAAWAVPHVTLRTWPGPPCAVLHAWL